MLKQILIRHLINIPGFRTNRKILIIESDDWGSIRIPSNKVYNKLLESSLVSPNDPFSRFDNLENEQDLLHLFDVLTSVKDKNDRNAVITANFVTTNPDFNKIRNDAFAGYHYEPISDTYKNYYSQNNLLETIRQGIVSGIFIPQFHGREHLNVQQWMALLQKKNDAFIKAFSYRVFAINILENSTRRNNLMATLDFKTSKDRVEINESLKEGYNLFKNQWEYESTSFIAPCYVWDDSIEKTLSEIGVKCLQGTKKQNVPVLNSSKYKWMLHFTGQKNKFGQTYLVRNALFEPSLNNKVDWVIACLKSIDIAFKWGKPAIIASHRINYIGSREKKNRQKNLQLLKRLLDKALTRWSDVEFMSTNEFYNAISN